MAITLNNTAVLHHEKGEYEQARSGYNESLEITRRMGDQSMIAKTLNNIALILLKKEKYEEALSYVSQAYKNTRKT